MLICVCDMFFHIWHMFFSCVCVCVLSVEVYGVEGGELLMTHTVYTAVLQMYSAESRLTPICCLYGW